MRSKDIFFLINEKLKKISPAQSIVPAEIYKRINSAIIKICTKHNASFEKDSITIITDQIVYPLTKTFKKIEILKPPQETGLDQYNYVLIENLSQYSQYNYYYSFYNDNIYFSQNQNNLADKIFEVWGWTIPLSEVGDEVEIPISPIWDISIEYYALHLLLPENNPEKNNYKLLAEEEMTSVAGILNKNRNQSFETQMVW